MINEEIKPTLKKPVSTQSQGFEKNFKKTMNQYDVKLNETDGILSEVEQSLKKKIFSLAKMEALVFSDSKLSAVYEGMSQNGEEKYGYHYNETIMNMLFNDYVLNSPKYLQKYKQAVPKEKTRRDKSGINQLKKTGVQTMQHKTNIKPQKLAQTGLKPEVVEEKTNETTGAGSAGGFAPALGIQQRQVDETSTTSSVGGSGMGSGAYVGPAVWGKGNLMKGGGKSKAMTKPMIKGGKIIQESKVNYLIDPSGFEKYVESLNEDDRSKEINYIDKKSDAYGTETNNMSKGDLNVIDKQLKTGKVDKPNLKSMEETTIDEKSKSKSQQRFMGMVHGVQKGELSPNKVGGSVAKAADSMKYKDADDFASTKHKGLPEKIKEDTQTMIQNNGTSMSNKAVPTGDQSGVIDMGTRTSGGGSMSENKDDMKLLEELNKELDAYSIHHKKLKEMSEDRRPSALILKDRLGNENEKNFKKDLQQSDTKQVIDVEKALEWKDQQTDVGKDPQKLGQEIEKKELKVTDGGQALKDVGNSANDKGDEIPKRNLTNEEQDEVNMYRLGLGDLVYDNEPGKRFEDRMKADMGDKLYKLRQDKLAFRGKAPMYNKDTQPVEDGVKKAQFNKYESGWNEREGLKESVVSGKYFNSLGKRSIIDFNLNEVVEIKDNKSIEKLQEVNLEGMGNTYNNKVDINESAVKAMDNYKFYTDSKKVFVMKNPVQNLNENEQKVEKRPINEQFEKMKHLTGYKPDDFTNTKGTKENRGF